MPRRVFYSFHYQSDAWRAAMVRQIGAVEGNASANDNDWETIKRGGDSAISRWINSQLEGRSCTVVLVGAETAQRRWVQYEIEQSWRKGMGVFGIRIHRLLNANRAPSKPGGNPFDFVQIGGRSLSAVVPLYDPPGMNSQEVYGNISNSIQNWIERAITAR
ncbi:TPA: TIR domain-containing protein [Stenotrophomonas maltophilia]